MDRAQDRAKQILDVAQSKAANILPPDDVDGGGRTQSYESEGRTKAQEDEWPGWLER